MPSRNETMRAFERLRLATPICDDASLVKVEEFGLRPLSPHQESDPYPLLSSIHSFRVPTRRSCQPKI
jgi:hypothetical protein